MRAISTGSTNIIESLLAAVAVASTSEVKSRSAANSVSSAFENMTANQPVSTRLLPQMDAKDEERVVKWGSIFERRTDWSLLLSRLPITRQNAIHVRLEDEGPFGNDEARLYILSYFSSIRLKEISCLLCSCVLTIYDRFPLVDGNFKQVNCLLRLK